MATGSELSLAVTAAATLEAEGIATRVVSMPCLEWFAAQPEAYRESVLPSAVRARVAVEAASPMSWWRLVGDAGGVVGLDHYGASAAAATLFEKFGFTAEAVCDAVRASLSRASS
jgi:transketolase